MVRIHKISMITSLLGLWFTSFFSNNVQVLIGFLLIFIFGILHGANDLIIIASLNQENDSKNFFKILILYLLLITLTSILFIFTPSLAIILFIAISGYHFGEQHWQDLNEGISKKNKIIFCLNYGMFILLLLFNFHIPEVQIIIQNITSHLIPVIVFKVSLYIVSCMLLIQSFWFMNHSNYFINTAVIQILYLLVFSIIFKVASLIWGFTIYFIMWHSIPSLYDQIKFLYGRYTFKNFISYVKSAFVYWMLSLLGILLLYYLLKDETIFDAIFFSFLAAITFPHVWVISKMFKTKETG